MKRAILLLAWCACMFGARTTVTDTIYTLDGTVFTGRISITAPAMVTSGGAYVAAWQKVIDVTDGSFSLAMEPNDTATPANTSYTVRMFPKSGQSSLEYWVVPTSASPVTIGTIRTSQIPTPTLTVALTQLSRTGGSKGCLVAFSTTWGAFCGGSNDQVLTRDTAQTYGVKWATPAAAATWGNITGTVSNQTDLATALAAKAALSHSHAISDLTATGTPSSSTYLRGDGSWAAVSGTGNMSATHGNGAPVASCASPTDRYIDDTNQDEWFCSAANTWKKNLSTGDSGAFLETGANSSGTPTTPSLGYTTRYFSSSKVGQTVDDTGAIATMIRPGSCGSNYMTGVSSAGVILCSTGGGAGTNGFTAQKTITINHLQVSSTLTNFPVLVAGTFAYLATTGNGGSLTSSSGYDVWFTSDSGCTTQIPYERVGWNATTGVSEFWVSLGTISSSVDTVFYLCYGKSSITTDQSNATGVWASDYKLVTHLKDGSTLTPVDSTSNAATMTLTNTPTATAGQIDGAANFVAASSQSINAGAGSALDITGNITVSAWVNLTSNPSVGLDFELVAKDKDSGGRAYVLDVSNVGGNTVGRFYVNGGSGITANNQVNGVTVIPTGEWHLLHGVFAPGSTLKLYLDGTQDANSGSAISAIPTATANLRIGAREYSGFEEWCNCKIDEVRVSNAVKSAAWIAAEYYNQQTGSTFLSITP